MKRIILIGKSGQSVAELPATGIVPWIVWEGRLFGFGTAMLNGSAFYYEVTK